MLFDILVATSGAACNILNREEAVAHNVLENRCSRNFAKLTGNYLQRFSKTAGPQAYSFFEN